MARKPGRTIPAKRSSRRKPTVAGRSRLTRAHYGAAAGGLLLVLGLLTLLALVVRTPGSLLGRWAEFIGRLWGWGVYLFPVWLLVGGVGTISLTTRRFVQARLPLSRVIGLLVLCLAVLTGVHLFMADPWGAVLSRRGGGLVGYWLGRVLTNAIGVAGGWIVVLAVSSVALTLAFGISLPRVVSGGVLLARHAVLWMRRAITGLTAKREARLEREEPSILAPSRPLGSPGAPTPSAAESDSPEVYSREGLAPPIDRLSGLEWMLPSIETMLEDSDDSPMSLSDIRHKARIIEETLYSLGVPATVVEVNPGPVVTQYGLEPGYVERRDKDGALQRVKVKVSRIVALSNDLALALAASPIRIEAPVPGKGVVGLEVPNRQAAVVGLRGVIGSDEFRALPSHLAVALGRDVSGAVVVDDLAKLPHLLIAGATGSGKSVCVNALIACLLCHNTPEQLKMLMIDPKRVELSGYNGIPHLVAPVVVEMDRVVGVLNWVTREMDHRYREFARVGARHISAYNESAAARGDEAMPYIAVFIDELADLMMVAPDEVERAICRIAQMARATGIHLVIATQRPSVDVVTGLIKANFPARVCFAVSSQVDSRVVLDAPGADKLLGRGDALYMAPDSPQLLRMQGCWVSDVEINRLAAFWRGQAYTQGGALYGPGSGGSGGQGLTQQALWPDLTRDTEEDDEADPLLDGAIDLVVREGRASITLLQRLMGIGYSRAARLIDSLEAQGVVGPATGSSKAREVLRDPREPKSDLDSPEGGRT